MLPKIDLLSHQSLISTKNIKLDAQFHSILDIVALPELNWLSINSLMTCLMNLFIMCYCYIDTHVIIQDTCFNNNLICEQFFCGTEFENGFEKSKHFTTY